MEEWRDIKGFEGRYQVSNTGKVLSLHYLGHDSAKELTPKKNNSGYLWVDLYQGKKATHYLIHRLVAKAFIPNPNNYPIVNHLDENPLNNSVENLEWCTNLYNIRYSRERHPENLYKPRLTYRNKNPHKLLTPVNQISLDGKIVHTFENVSMVVRKTGYHNTSIKECCEHKRKTAYGYKWEYAN